MLRARPHSFIDFFLTSANRFHNSFFALLFPWACPGCNTLLEYPGVVCHTCERLFTEIHPPVCKLCGVPFPETWRIQVCADCNHRRPFVTAIRSAYDYDGLIAQMIKEAKYLRKGRYMRYFSDKLYVLARNEFPDSISAIVPVPLHRSREWNRTFNQAEILAIGIAKLWGLPVWKALRKQKITLPQSSLSGSVRRLNLKNTFQFRDQRSKFKSVLLVDDVVTTGSTLGECARILKRNGVKRVYAVTVARAELR